ncbi:hypothetical protein A9Q84_01735 [Halobacteriovorax marinus]|uniref:HTH marR-type domain-containing protein n=1 Tax=Halobacteriovorax marinus TaxID=97084 RepID=A0A1Y5FCC5_9BACT|nr:hypothetical protein A9Q84_01735 [Halobacteriovorax marinus]
MSKKVSIEDALCFNLYTASRLMTQVYRPYLKKIGLTYPQFLVMTLLWKAKGKDSDKGTTVKELGTRLYLDSGTLTPLLKRLEAMELLTRKRSTHDEREVLITLSRKGINLEKKSESIPMEMFCNLNLTMDSFIEIRDGVKEVLANLHDKVNEDKN